MMSDLTRKQRYIGLVRSLLKVAIEQKQVTAGAGLARLIARLEGWDKEQDPPGEKPAPVDLSGLLAHITPGERNAN